jgi:hypothetical protein
LIDLCRNQLKNHDVKKDRGREGAVMLGIILRAENDQVSPNPISGGGRSETHSQPKTAPTPDQVWESIDPSLQADVHAMVEEVWSYANKADRDFVTSFADWVAHHSIKPNWKQLRAETWRYLKSTDDGRSIARRLKALEQQQTHSHSAAA